VEGGGECDLENIRTLCLLCHRLQTTELRRRLAATDERARSAPETP
jgi:5-methylcytosine-specific restriction protein A